MKKFLISVLTALLLCLPYTVYGSTLAFLPIDQQYTESTFRIKSDDGLLYFVAVMETHSYNSQYYKAKALYDYVMGYMEYDKEQMKDKANPKYVYTSSQAIARHKGICYDYSLFYAALCRSIGIPTQVTKGYVQLDNQQYYHAWNRVYINNIWINVDTTFGDASEDYKKLYFNFIPSDRSITEIEG